MRIAIFMYAISYFINLITTFQTQNTDLGGSHNLLHINNNIDTGKSCIRGLEWREPAKRGVTATDAKPVTPFYTGKTTNLKMEGLIKS
jgi:hypothetical protein